MLSIEDVYREMGKNIFISPLDPYQQFEDNFILLTASENAWTYEPDEEEKSAKSIYREDIKEIVIPPHKTGCIVTNEAMYVGNNIGGIFQAVEYLAGKGLIYMGTPIAAPSYCGQPLVLLHNTTDKELSIHKGDKIVSVIFDYLHTPIVASHHVMFQSHVARTHRLDVNHYYDEWSDKNGWIYDDFLLRKHFEKYDKEKFEDYRKVYAQHKTIRERIWSKHVTKNVIKYAMIIGTFVAVYFYLLTHYPPAPENTAALLLTGVICVVTTLINDMTNAIKKK